jgi:hypothetical protein
MPAAAPMYEILSLIETEIVDVAPPQIIHDTYFS